MLREKLYSAMFLVENELLRLTCITALISEFLGKFMNK